MQKLSGTTVEIFTTYVQKVVNMFPVGGQQRTLLWDNFAAHHHAAVHNVVNFAGHRVVVPPSRRSVVLQYQAPFVSHFVLRMVCKG
jgi:hypothetical protein